MELRESHDDVNRTKQATPDRIRDYTSRRHFIADLLATIGLSALIAVFVALVGISPSFLVGMVMSQSFGISICVLISILFRIIKPDRLLSLAAIVVAGIIGGTITGMHLGRLILGRFFSVVLERPENSSFQTFVLCFAFSCAICYFFYSRSRLSAVKEAMQRERIGRLSSEKGALEARLRLLQAQIEPHFLFNTLSNVLSLIDTDPGKGKLMLTDLIRYLRTSLSRTLPEATTLGQEMETVSAYLSIQKIRMGERLRFSLDVPAAVLALPFPPMLLQPLVENAVKHGLEPQIEGGEVIVKATEEGGLMRIEVIDTGPGLASFEHTGVGMANVRERLELLYGGKGRLILEENKPHGVRAVIEVPARGL